MITTTYSGCVSNGLTSFYKDGKLVAEIHTYPDNSKKNIIIIETTAVMEFPGSEKTGNAEFPYRSVCWEWDIYNNVSILAGHRARHMMRVLTGDSNWLW